jgi:nickel superoxide dismutase
LENTLKQLLIGLIISVTTIFGHCQVPCGIFDDARRILEIEELVNTIEKAMGKIEVLSHKNNQSAQDMNQLIRWVNTKEEHAQKIQNTILAYFLAQRIKPKEVQDNEYQKYVKLTTICQKIIYVAMKTKQTVDLTHIKKLNTLINSLIDTYFNAHGKEHIHTLKTH